jgi:hypothetical protein
MGVDRSDLMRHQGSAAQRKEDPICAPASLHFVALQAKRGSLGRFADF